MGNGRCREDPPMNLIMHYETNASKLVYGQA